MDFLGILKEKQIHIEEDRSISNFYKTKPQIFLAMYFNQNLVRRLIIKEILKL